FNPHFIATQRPARCHSSGTSSWKAGKCHANKIPCGRRLPSNTEEVAPRDPVDRSHEAHLSSGTNAAIVPLGQQAPRAPSTHGPSHAPVDPSDGRNGSASNS